jgi:dipeptidyl aminopeptidase/acylaminoacyl peptidase
VSHGLADPRRICIVGEQYGGYAALMGVARQPSPFRCAVALQAITDLGEYASNWEFFNDQYRAYGIPVLIGDVERDGAQLKAASPLHRAGEIRAPVLLAYRDGNRQYPVGPGARMRDALRESGATVEWVEYPAEGARELERPDTVDLWKRVEKFLGTHLAEP